MLKTPSVLFVCTANLCRSPMAEALFRDLLLKRGLVATTWQTGSAGTWTKPGLPLPESVQKVLSGRGVELQGHLSRPISAKILEDYALVLVMEQGHKEALQIEFPEQAIKIFLLTEMSGKNYSIPDPAGHAFKEYERTAELIWKELENGFDRICELALRG